MMNLLFGLFLAASLLNGFVFGGSLFWSIIAALVAAGFLAFRLLPFIHVPSGLRQMISTAGLILLLAVSFLGGLKTADTGYLAYDQGLADAAGLLSRESYAKAAELLADLEKTYGATDQILMNQARAAIGQKNGQAAESLLSRVSSRQSDQYYILMGQAYLQQKKGDQVKALYLDAARRLPLWDEAQLIAGTQAATAKDYAIAEYFLLRANEQMPAYPVPLYYLGVIRFEQGLFTEADEFFTEALQVGADDEMAGHIAWYYEQMEGSKS